MSDRGQQNRDSLMRAALAARSPDRFARTITWTTCGLVGVFFTFVALPLASSSPYPTPTRQDWMVSRAPTQSGLVPGSSPSHEDERAAPASFSLASALSSPAAPETAAAVVNVVRTFSIRRPIGDANDEPEVDRRIRTASLGGVPTAEPPHEERPAATPSLPDEVVATAPAEHPTVVRPRGTTTLAEIDAYLWEVYQRSPTKRDRGGDFTWKDPAAARRVGLTLQAYVIAGMDADLREQLYHAGKAMDAAGIEWTIASGFRDDWRQSIANGIKARTGYSRHGGSRATGGYGHGRAVDVGHADGKSHMMVWRWLDQNGARYGLNRPLRHFDPPHVEPRNDWRRIAAQLRRLRTVSSTQ
jgi:hypothetical protein